MFIYSQSNESGKLLIFYQFNHKNQFFSLIRVVNFKDKWVQMAELKDRF